TGAAVVLMVLVVGWVAAAARLLAASRRRPGALAEVLVATALAAAAGAAVGFLNGVETGRRLLTGGEQALVFGLSAAVVVFIIAVGTATVAPSRDEPVRKRGENRAAIPG
ncbi:MAG TPA: hypothetical protein VGC90_03545, partial [Candidatus Limnocylindrales bacterium]